MKTAKEVRAMVKQTIEEIAADRCDCGCCDDDLTYLRGRLDALKEVVSTPPVCVICETVLGPPEVAPKQNMWCVECIAMYNAEYNH